MDLEESDISKVLFGDNSKCEVKGIGKVKLALYDSSEKILTSIRFVPID